MSCTTPSPVRRRLRHLTALCAAAGAFAAVAPGLASASEATVNSNGVLTYTAAAGEPNRLVISHNDDFLILTDNNTAITPGPGCLPQAPAPTIACAPAQTANIEL